MGRTPITPRAILWTLSKVECWDTKNETVLRNEDFINILLLEEISSSERTIKGWLNRLISMKFFRRANKSAVIVDLEKVADYLGLIRHDHSAPGAPAVTEAVAE